MKKKYGDSMKKEIIKAVRQMDGRTKNGRYTIEFIYGRMKSCVGLIKAVK